MNAFLVNGGLPVKYQCTNESKTSETPNIFLGIYCVAFGTIFIPIYLLCLAALIQRDLRAIVVYKLMIFLSITDVVMIVINSLVTGFFFIHGAVFCSYPIPMYIVGSISLSSWAGNCIGCLCLVFTRLVDLWKHKWHDILFGGRRVWAMIALCMAYAACFLLFPTPGLFNVKYYSWIFDPMITDDDHIFQVDLSWMLASNNIIAVSLTFLLYILFFLSFLYKYHSSGSSSFHITSNEKQIFLQSISICGINLSLALIYVYMMYFPATIAMTIAGLFLWQISSAGAVVVYIGINKTVRRKIQRMFFGKSKVGSTIAFVSFTHK